IEGRGTEHGGVWLDTYAVENWEHWRKDRARSYIWPAKLGVDVRRAEVGPTSHYTLGGVRINEKAETGVDGLYAAGEVAGGIHGANRIGGNALADCMVFGEIAGREAALARREIPNLKPDLINQEQDRLIQLFGQTSKEDSQTPIQLISRLRQVMYHQCGVVRSKELLDRATNELQEIREAMTSNMVVGKEKHYNAEWIWALDLESMLTISELTVNAASLRKESRGAHFRVDFPEPDNTNWMKHILAQLDDKDKINYSYIPVEFPYVQLMPDRIEPPFKELEVDI
ncbi:FAD-binding protein, partial [Chloroflexota bacterium]